MTCHASVTRDSRVSHTDVTGGVTHLSPSPVPSRPVPSLNSAVRDGMHRYFCSARVRADACRGASR